MTLPLHTATHAGLRLYDCPPFRARITVEACERSKAVALSIPARHKAVKLNMRGRGRSRVRLSTQEVEERRVCLTCPGVVALARRRARGG